jgi:hypothetical protein
VLLKNAALDESEHALIERHPVVEALIAAVGSGTLRSLVPE